MYVFLFDRFHMIYAGARPLLGGSPEREREREREICSDQFTVANMYVSISIK